MTEQHDPLALDIAQLMGKYPPRVLLPVFLDCMKKLVALTQRDPLKIAQDIAADWSAWSIDEVNMIKGAFYGATQLGIAEKEIYRGEGPSAVRILHTTGDLGARGEGGGSEVQQGDPRRFRKGD